MVSEHFSIVSYNILVPHYAHVNKPCFKEAPPGSPQWLQRRDALVAKIASLAADVVCMQEVERFNDISQEMQKAGYLGINTSRNNGEEEGCCLFYKKDVFVFERHEDLYFDDNTGRMAQIIDLTHITSQKVFQFVNTHIIYNNKDPSKQENEIQSLAGYLSSKTIPCVICGDFNISPNDRMVSHIKNLGFRDSHQEMNCDDVSFVLFRQQACPGAEFKKDRIDYIFTKEISVVEAGVYGDPANLSTSQEPSDHLPVYARLAFNQSSAAAEEVVHYEVSASSRKTLMLSIAQDFQDGTFDKAIKKFKDLPTNVKNRVFGKAYEILKLSTDEKLPYKIGEYGFLRRKGMDFDNTVRSEAIKGYITESGI
ncbi:MAG: hypothetical protein FJZ57_05330 [Chlamydiae bacterium]|nr:hypothetical protein [Chlamydiota bacterium]